MKLPRDISGEELAKRLTVFGYEITRQAGSHLRLTTTQQGEHHITIPLHNPLKSALWLEFLRMSPRISNSVRMTSFPRRSEDDRR